MEPTSPGGGRAVLGIFAALASLAVENYFARNKQQEIKQSADKGNQQRNNKRKAWMVWNTSGESDWTVPKGWEVTAFESADSGAGRIHNNVIRLGQTPLLLKREILVWSP